MVMIAGVNHSFAMLRSSQQLISQAARSQGLKPSVRWLSAQDLDNYKAVNDPIREYLPGSTDRERLEKRLAYYCNTCTEIPIVIGDEQFHTKDVHYQVMPFDHQKKLAKFSYADKPLIEKAIETARKAQRDWERQPYEKRAEVFLKAAELLADNYRMDVNATTMLGQAKTIVQAEIDAACELVDFLTFNVQFGWQATRYQPISVGTVTNTSSFRGMEGFWASIAPFNFTAIGGNLASAPALAGNASLWKASDTAMLSNYTVFKVFREAGLPAGVINFVPADGPVFGETVTNSPHLAGINFTGSVETFENLWKGVANNIGSFVGFPRMIGECGGKNFHLVHKTADLKSVINGTIMSAFEFCGQKCSACSRLFLPKSCAQEVIDGLVEAHKEIKVGSPLEVSSYLSAVIDDKSFSRISSYLEHARTSSDCEVLAGGECDNSKGYFVQPTIVLCKDRNDKLLREEIFGPVLSIYVYNDDADAEIINHINTSTRYALTGSIFAKDQQVLDRWSDALRYSVGNFYVNDKSTGSVVGQQPFGGARKSGTNDKAGGPHYLLKFMSPLSIKSNSGALTDWRYKYMQD
ncbi:delta-1-pyrroline-5-carboxylate dehydrogenase, mitochondrial-like [Watersipora subatra]|uniref:delta-1-pyrroline-5-carboxylate dehydrogenase, mitochondrial-like n=1 Tax=Watersipora subatra TaxID=2589382 RepID=UPI00355B5C7E